MKMNKKIIANHLNQRIKEVSSEFENKTKWDLNPKKYPERVIEAYKNAEGTCPIDYTALDYEHPPVLFLDPPHTINQDQALISRATYYNDTDNEVNFGLLSTDEMMIVFGLVYFN